MDAPDTPAPERTPTHCAKGHYAQWCDCRTFVPAEPGRYTSAPTIRYPEPAPERGDSR